MPSSSFHERLSCNNSSSDQDTKRLKRRRAPFYTAIAVSASAFAASVSSTVAFVHHPTVCRDVQDQSLRQKRRQISRNVLKDPTEMMLFVDSEDMRPSDLSALEELYLMSNGYYGLGDIVEDDSPKHSSPIQKEEAKNTTPVRQNAEKESLANVAPRSRPQFRGLSTTAKKRPSQQRTSTASRSSTMPGFIERGMTGRQIAYDDGIRLAESRAQVDLSSHVNSEKQKKHRRKINGEALYKASNSVPDSLVHFANEIHDVERITPKEEKELGAKTQEAIRLQNIYDNLSTKLDREPTDDEWCAEAGKINMEAISQAIEEGLEAKNRLVTSNLRMVQGVVNLYIRNGLTGQYNAGDLMQEGILALIRAAEKYDPSKGFRFSTYAMYWIRASIKRSQLYQSRVITVPQRLFESHKRIVQVQADLTVSLGRTPTKKEIGEVVGMSELQIERCIKAISQQTFSIDQELQNSKKPSQSAGEKKATMEEIIDFTDAEANAAERALLRNDLVETLYRHLPEEDVHVLLLRFGLLEEDRKSINPTGAMKTIAEVSRIIGYKPDKVRRIINRSLAHMKASIGKDWSDFERQLP